MNSKSVSAEATNERRVELLAAAIRVLAREGLAETTTRKIAAEAGVNQATLLYYFGSKDDLLFAVLQEMMLATQEIALQGVPQATDLREAVAGAIRAFWRQVEATPELQIMQYELTLYALRNPDAAWLAKEQYAGYCVVVETLLRETYAAAGQTSAIPFDALARFIVGGLDGIILQFVSDRDPARARGDVEYLIQSVIALAEGTAPTPDSSPTARESERH
jgi:AcrR family transcriptional regulator